LLLCNHSKFKLYQLISVAAAVATLRLSGGGGATRHFPRNGGAKELHEDPIVEPRPKSWTRDQEWRK